MHLPPPAPQIVFDEKELRREISHAIKNVHGVRQVELKQKSLQSSHTQSSIDTCVLFLHEMLLLPHALLFSLHQSCYSTVILVFTIKACHHRLKVPIQSGIFRKLFSVVREMYFLSSTFPHCSSNPLISSLLYHPLLFCVSAEAFNYYEVLCYMFVHCSNVVMCSSLILSCHISCV